MLFGCFILLLEIQTKTTSSTQAAVAATASARAIKRDKKQAYEHIRPDHTFEVYGKKFFVLSTEPKTPQFCKLALVVLAN